MLPAVLLALTLTCPSAAPEVKPPRAGLGVDSTWLVHPDGAIDVLDLEINTCGSYDRIDWQRHFHAEPGGPLREGPLPDDAGILHLGGHGWLYGQDDGRLLAVAQRHTTVIPGYRNVDHPTAPIQVATNFRVTVAIFGRDLISLDGPRARVLDHSVPDHVSEVALDARGRVLIATWDGPTFRWSRRDGWREVASPCP